MPRFARDGFGCFGLANPGQKPFVCVFIFLSFKRTRSFRQKKKEKKKSEPKLLGRTDGLSRLLAAAQAAGFARSLRSGRNRAAAAAAAAGEERETQK